MSGFNELCDDEAERLALLSEELGEAIQAIGKIQRHGYGSYDPTLPDHKQISNRVHLEHELGHVMFAMRLMVNRNDLLQDNINSARRIKATKIQRYLHHNEIDPAEIP